MKSYSTLNKLYFTNILSKKLIESHLINISYVKIFYKSLFILVSIKKLYFFMKSLNLFIKKIKKITYEYFESSLIKKFIINKVFCFLKNIQVFQTNISLSIRDLISTLAIKARI